LFWLKPGSYKTVFSFVKAILEGVSTAKWCLQCLDERSPAARKSVESQAGAAAVPQLQPAPTDERPAENDPLDTGVAEQVSLEPDASADVAASSSSDAGVFRSVEAAGMVFERSPCFSWLLIKAVEAERSSSSDYDSCPQAAAAMELFLGDVVGEGSFAQVKQCVRKHTGEKVAVKILKDEFDEPLDFLREVSICSSLVHPNIVRLVDVLVKPKRTLVFAWAGPTLYEACRKHAVWKANWTAVALQLLAGAAYFHAKFLAHTDLKPKNMCWESGRLTIVDFGQAIVTIPGFRACYETKQIEKTCLLYGTLNYRSPEVLCGDAAWERPMDIWAAGLVIAEVWSSQDKRPLLAVNSAVDALMSILANLAAPSRPTCPTSRSSRHSANSFRY
jgi:protein kinase